MLSRFDSFFQGCEYLIIQAKVALEQILAYPPGLPAGDRGPAYPSCHWYLALNRTTPWVKQTGDAKLLE